MKEAKRNGFSDRKIADLWNQTANQVRATRLENNIVPVYKMVDTCLLYTSLDVPLIELDTKAYRDDVKSEQDTSLIPIEIDGTDVILVDDVLYTGRTIRAAIDLSLIHISLSQHLVKVSSRKK